MYKGYRRKRKRIPIKLPVGEFTDEVGIKAAHGKAVRIRFDSRGGDTPVTEMFAGPDGRLAELPGTDARRVHLRRLVYDGGRR